jgi:hypothetical protein
VENNNELKEMDSLELSLENDLETMFDNFLNNI